MAHNRFSLIGNLTKLPQLRTTGAGKSVATISIAVNRVLGSGADRTERADFFQVTLWEKQAENAERFLSTGREIFVEGRLEPMSYDKDGQKHYVIDLIAENVEYLGGGRSHDDGRVDKAEQRQPMSNEDLSSSFE